MANLHHIFTHESQKYHELVSKEDYQDNLIKTISSLTDLYNKDIIEFAAGTGRLTFKLCEYARTVHAFDKSREMLTVAEKNKKELQISNCSFKQTPSEALPPSIREYDLAISGWGFAFAVLSSSENVDKQKQNETTTTILKNMNKAIKKSGIIIIVETLGTCRETPEVPDALLNIYEDLENTYGFSRKEIRTDFMFDSIEEAVDLMTFFFGEECEEYIRSHGSLIIPECTGVWYREKFPQS